MMLLLMLLVAECWFLLPILLFASFTENALDLAAMVRDLHVFDVFHFSGQLPAATSH